MAPATRLELHVLTNIISQENSGTCIYHAVYPFLHNAFSEGCSKVVPKVFYMEMGFHGHVSLNNTGLNQSEQFLY